FHWREVIRIAKNIALGLRHAHDRGVIHRDLKPGNLLRAHTGIIKITDFGIAKSFGQNQNTGTNVLGTVDFMSPEQAKGQPVTMRSDLYSLGTVMYTLLAGNPPFSANSVEESMRNLTKVPAPRISRKSPDVPQKLDNLIAQLLEKDPAKRVPTALSLYHQLRKVEQLLLDSSRAVTAERPMNDSSSNTSIVSDSTDIEVVPAVPTLNDSNLLTESRLDSDVVTRHDENENSRACDPGPSLVRGESDGEDFFNRVTEDERQKHLELEQTEPEDTASSLGKILLAVALVVVLGLATLGVYRANQVPAAELLLAKIDEAWEQPQKRITEIKEFLTHYPEHENVKMIEGRLNLARAYQRVHKLRALRKSDRELKPIEQNLVEIIDDASKDAPKAYQQLQALVNLYNNQNNLSESELIALMDAKAYVGAIKIDAERQKTNVRETVKQQLAQADELPEDEAKVVYESIIELNKQFSWLYDLIEIADSKLNRINSNTEDGQQDSKSNSSALKKDKANS
ncbi:MAG: protein kinase, partial [Planctomycetota bacterium]